MKPMTPTHRVLARENCYTDLTVACEGHADLVPVAVPDLSPHGMFIPTPCYFPQGAVLKLSFRLVHTRVEIHARAEVRHCAGGLGVGVEFVDLLAEQRRAIEEELAAIRALEPAAP